MAAVNENYTGTQGSRYYLRIEATEDSINTANNTSRVVVYVKMRTTNNYGYYDSTNQTGYVDIDGQRFTFNSNYPSSGTKDWGPFTKTITHDANGTKSIGIDAYHNANQGSGLGTSTPAMTMTLTTIDRYADITTFSLTNVTDTSFTVNVTANATCDILQYSLNGAAFVTQYSGNFTSRSFTLSDLKSGTAYTLAVKVRRDDSGLYTTSSTKSATTLVQNNFFDFI